MRIIAGSIKNKLIPSIKKGKYRPTAAFLREAIFNILESLSVDVKESEVLDVFAGTGSMAFEALSRGAKKATLLDINARYVNLGRKFILENNLNAKYVQIDCSHLPEANQKYDLIFIDPPYESDIFFSTFESLLIKGWVKKDAILVAELPCYQVNFELPENCNILKDKKYKSTRLLVIKLSTKGF